MNNFRKFLYGASALLLMTGCSDEIMNSGQDSNGGLENDGPGVYIGVNFKMPGMGSTRSFTNGDNESSGGVEVGTDIENNVNEVLLILARPNDYGFIGAATVLRNNIYEQSGANPTYHAVAKFDATDLNQYYGDPTVTGTAKGKVAVFVIANPVGAMSDALATAAYGSTAWLNTPKAVTVDANGQTEGAVWSTTNGGHFLMSNQSIAIRQIPTDPDAWKVYTTEDQSFNLSGQNGVPGDDSFINNSATEEGGVQGNGGAILIERAAARMDFRDGSADPVNNPNTYHVVTTDVDGTETPLIDIKLNRMCLVNMGKQFYILRRVSANGLDTDVQICGPEKPWYQLSDGTLVEIPGEDGNYVVDFFATQKAAGIKTNFSQYFNYTFFDNDGTFNVANVDLQNNNWYVSNIADVLADGTPDQWSGSSNGSTVAKGTYRVWRYLTENTIPGIDTQKNGISTGVVFKGKMQANKALYKEGLTEEDADYENQKWTNLLINTINNENGELGNASTDPKLYSYAGNLYVTWENIYEAAIKASFSYTYDAEGNVVAEWNRSSTFYKAIFGENGGTGYSVKNSAGEIIYTDPLALNSTSANSAYIAWAADKTNASLLAAFRSAVTAQNITIYESSNDPQLGWGYYCYYYYWNRHNDNGQNGIMGPMEFAVVRNNVYKLAVTKIAKLGHPRISSNDPEPPTPDTDDETGNMYLTVDSEVVPWVVRVNDIEF